MQTLRHARHIARFVLVWFALSIGVAIASPLVKPQSKSMDLICTGAGMVLLQAQTGDNTDGSDGGPNAASLTLDCPLCLLGNMAPPPPVAGLTAEPVQPLAHVMQGIPAARLASLTGAPLPARGPPAFS